MAAKVCGRRTLLPAANTIFSLTLFGHFRDSLGFLGISKDFLRPFGVRFEGCSMILWQYLGFLGVYGFIEYSLLIWDKLGFFRFQGLGSLRNFLGWLCTVWDSSRFSAWDILGLFGMLQDHLWHSGLFLGSSGIISQSMPSQIYYLRICRWFWKIQS